MTQKFELYFEEELKIIKDYLTNKNGKRIYVKVIERVGRDRQKYPSTPNIYWIMNWPESPKTWSTISGA